MLLVPGNYAPTGPAPAGNFDQEFFRREFKDGQVPRCDLIDAGDVDVVELVLMNGRSLDINCFEEFRRGYLVATVFVNPPQCDHLYRTYVRYDSIFQVNVRRYDVKDGIRKLGFHKHKVVIETLQEVAQAD